MFSMYAQSYILRFVNRLDHRGLHDSREVAEPLDGVIGKLRVLQDASPVGSVDQPDWADFALL